LDVSIATLDSSGSSDNDLLRESLVCLPMLSKDDSLTPKEFSYLFSVETSETVESCRPLSPKCSNMISAEERTERVKVNIGEVYESLGDENSSPTMQPKVQVMKPKVQVKKEPPSQPQLVSTPVLCQSLPVAMAAETKSPPPKGHGQSLSQAYNPSGQFNQQNEASIARVPNAPSSNGSLSRHRLRPPTVGSVTVRRSQRCGHLNNIGRKICAVCRKRIPLSTSPAAVQKREYRLRMKVKKLLRNEIRQNAFRN